MTVPIAADQAFYAAAAPILAVLLLVIAVGEARLTGRGRGDRRPPILGTLLTAVVSLLLVVCGIVSALCALASGHDSGPIPAFTAAGLAFGMGFITLRLTIAMLDDFGSEPEVFNRQLRFVTLISLTVTLGTMFALYFSAR